MTDMLAKQLPINGHIWQETLHWLPSDEQQGLFEQLYQGIVAGNRQVNLTRITEPDGFWEKHLWDSLSGLAPWCEPQKPEWLPTVKTVIDIGTGGGFPGVPVAIARSQWHVTLLDSTRKKIAFLQTLCEQLGLTNTTFLAERAEVLGRDPKHRAQYDLAMVRAVGPASTCAEYALPLLKKSGFAVLFRGQWTDEEEDLFVGALDTLGGELVAICPWETPLTQGVRHCLYVKKVAKTDNDFPRTVGMPAKHPL
ncbi:16s rrna methyltransferase [Leptolyngbya sp. Heron Island J]|uniref:16S rRNA (guanine(527)-N(7))-methyltransferase RsmG n=1 Tax=Leptolyngbya sp. Heron Island J TaxID=1385935 RepID=UPI0003B9E087|nr:16S rRNA (guanine(527)-N(7))-methyltransferase RsmG [Leptolyngbya sp. Heron Island J]ESA35512.1 16s rrna methyltransferase [Leptolyngbya sp. Heron Island J]